MKITGMENIVNAKTSELQFFFRVTMTNCFTDDSANLLVDLPGQDRLSIRQHHLFLEDPASINQSINQSINHNF